MSHWTIGRRLAVAFTTLVLVLGVLASVFLWSLGGIRRSVVSITTDNVPGLNTTNTLLKDAMRYRIYTLMHIASSDAEEMKRIDEHCRQLSAEVLEDFQDYEKTIVQPAERIIFAKLAHTFEAYREQSRAIRALSNAEETAAAAEELNAQAVSLQESVAELLRLVGGAHQAAANPPPAGNREKTTKVPCGSADERFARRLGPRARPHPRAGGRSGRRRTFPRFLNS